MGWSTNKEIKMKLKDIERLHNKKLRKIIKLAYDFHPYYRRIFKSLNLRPSDIKTKDDLRKLPFTKKTDWVGREKEFILKPTKKVFLYLSFKDKMLYFFDKKKFFERIKWEFLPATFFATSGRTGNSAACFYTRYDFERIKETTINALQPIIKALNYKQKIQITFPYAPHLAFWHTIFGWLGEPNTFATILGAGRSNLQVEMMERFKINVLIGMPSYISYLSQLSVEKKAESNLRYIITAGEYLPESMRKKIKENFSEIGPEPKILQGYASTESKAAVFEREEKGGYVIDPKLHLWEVIDPKSGEPVSFGEKGILVFTHLDFRGTIFLRYWTSDIVEKGVIYEDGNLKLFGDIYRESDLMPIETKIKGTLINTLSLENLLNSLKEVKEYQVVITRSKDKKHFSLDELLIKISLHERYQKIRDKVIKKVQGLVKDYYEITPKVRVVPFEKIVDEIFEKLKGMHVVDLRFLKK
jgi:phenylacetate-CoA ligase